MDTNKKKGVPDCRRKATGGHLRRSYALPFGHAGASTG